MRRDPLVLALAVLLTLPVGIPLAGTMGDVPVFTSNLIGSEVKDRQGEKIGRIEELQINAKDGQISTVVISVGGLLGIGSKSVAIPWKEIMLESDGNSAIVAMSKEELQNAPSWKRPESRPGGCPEGPPCP